MSSLHQQFTVGIVLAAIGYTSFCMVLFDLQSRSTHQDFQSSKAMGAGLFDDSDRGKLFRVLLAGLPHVGRRARAARLELKYWYDHLSIVPTVVPDRQNVTTKDGTTREIVFLRSSAMSMPGTDFSMALLLNDRNVIDWVSCWTYNRTANHTPLLEDIDGDGFLDVAFESHDGWRGNLDKRKHTQPGSNRTWLYAYSIGANRLNSIFPTTDHNVRFSRTPHRQI
jgi:hypothetical protein